MEMKKGTFSIHSDNMFPIIKKWLYSDQDIFVRELISNGCDAVTKLKKLALVGEYREPEKERYCIRVQASAEQGTLRFTDNGLGMTAEEVDEYINQIAFSGAQDFMEQYKDKANDDQIIGHFGLGFYSAFMVADRVTIDSLSYKEGAKPVHWESDGGASFEMGEGDKAERGTTVTLYLNEDCKEYANEFRAKEVIEKYCSFMPVPIYFQNEDAKEETQIVDREELLDSDEIIETIVEEDTADGAGQKDKKAEETTGREGTEPAEDTEKKESGEAKEPEKKERCKIRKRPELLNEVHPLWANHPNSCTDQQYKEFYHKVFSDYRDPLFWIHLNMDYPFNLKGILYFPKINMEYESIEGTIKLYNNQVFIADNIKEVIPEFLLLLKGVIDCPDLPLNVSRSALQNDGFVKKISDYITKKVAEKLNGMCKTDRKTYETYWDDIAPFIKYGFLKDEKFAERINDSILFKNIDGKYLTLKDCLEENKERFENRIFYVTDEKEQGQYIRMFREEGIDAVILPHAIDMPFLSRLEQKNQDLKFLRIDADINDALREEQTEAPDEEAKKQEEALKKAVKKAIGNEKLTVRLENLKDEGTASLLTISEDSRRMREMMKQYGMGGGEDMFAGEGETLILNAKHPLVQYLKSQVIVVDPSSNNPETAKPSSDEGKEPEAEAPKDTADAHTKEDAKHPEQENGAGEAKPEEAVPEMKKPSVTRQLCQQLYDLARIQHGSLPENRMEAFIQRSNELLAVMIQDRRQK